MGVSFFPLSFPLHVDASAASTKAAGSAPRPASSIPTTGGARGMVVGGGAAGSATTGEVGGVAVAAPKRSLFFQSQNCRIFEFLKVLSSRSSKLGKSQSKRVGSGVLVVLGAMVVAMGARHI